MLLIEWKIIYCKKIWVVYCNDILWNNNDNIFHHNLLMLVLRFDFMFECNKFKSNAGLRNMVNTWFESCLSSVCWISYECHIMKINIWVPTCNYSNNAMTHIMWFDSLTLCHKTNQTNMKVSVRISMLSLASKANQIKPNQIKPNLAFFPSYDPFQVMFLFILGYTVCLSQLFSNSNYLWCSQFDFSYRV